MRVVPAPPLAWRSPATTVEPGREPLRTCIGCRRRATQRELVRVTRTVEGRLVVGRSQPGRGAWLCAGSVPCLDEAVRRKAFARALRGPVHDADDQVRNAFGTGQPNVRDWSAAGAAPVAPRHDTTTKG